ncbi:hypothetical protein ACHAW6_005823 [Cyclotella cf. meneghiniana]
MTMAVSWTTPSCNMQSSNSRHSPMVGSMPIFKMALPSNQLETSPNLQENNYSMQCKMAKVHTSSTMAICNEMCTQRVQYCSHFARWNFKGREILRSQGGNMKHGHTFRCPVYVLQNVLAAGNKIPKWSPRARLGINLGPFPHRARNVNLVLNLDTGHCSPQFHCW